MTSAIAVVADVSIVTALGLLACRLLRRQPAALRHLVLAGSLAAAALAPVFEFALPQWGLPVLSGGSQPTSSGAAFSSESPARAGADALDAPPSRGFPTTVVLMAVWGVGFIVVIAGLLGGLGRLVSTTRRCRPVRSVAWREQAARLVAQLALTRPVTVLESSDQVLLLTWGLLRPRIIVPTGAMSWSAERVNVVLAHELAHIDRRDWAIQIAAETLRAVHWFNPLIWLACRRLRDESEQACDDTVLGGGIAPADYASHLLAVARQVRSADRGWASAAAVANASTLERRIAAMLTTSRNRKPLTPMARTITLGAVLSVTAVVTAATLTTPVAADAIAPAVRDDIALVAPAPPRVQEPRPAVARPVRRAPPRAAAPAQEKPATLSGVLRDASGAVLPGVTVTVADSVSGMRYTVTSDASGTFVFQSLPPARYQMTARLPGFATIAQDLTLAAGAAVERRLEMRVGGLVETITVVCPVGGAASAPRPGAVVAFDRRPAATNLFAPQVVPLRVGGQISAPRQLKRVSPVCPGLLPPANGLTVILEGTIGADGLVKDVKVLRSIEPKEFVQSAVEAVSQWEFAPTRLNNEPIPVIVTVTVAFRRQ